MLNPVKLLVSLWILIRAGGSIFQKNGPIIFLKLKKKHLETTSIFDGLKRAESCLFDYKITKKSVFSF